MLGLSMDQLPEWNTILGLQFENLILNNIQPLAKQLQLARTPLIAAAPYFQKQTARRKGCQVDLLILTKHSLYVVEIKLRKSIEPQVIDEVKEKVRRLPADSERSIRTVLVYEGQLNKNVEDEGYFDFTIPFAQLLTSRP
jgi:hypothetical protein